MEKIYGKENILSATFPKHFNCTVFNAYCVINYNDIF
jgi:hypothetical protein